MNLYKYTAKDLYGNKTKGKINATSIEEVRSILKRRGYYIEDISFSNSKLNIELNFFSKIEYKDLASMTRELYFSLSAGVPILDALDVVTENTENKKLYSILKNVYKDVESGSLISKAFKKHKEIPSMFYSMIEIGEETGKLDDILNELSEYYNKLHIQNKKIKNALIYPKLLSTFSLVILVALIRFVVPMFIGNLLELNGKMPLPTKVVMNISDFIKSYGGFILAFLIFIYILKRIFLDKSREYIFLRDKLLIKSKIIGKVYTIILTARFSRTFSTLFAGGVSIVKCFEITANVMGNEYFKRKILEGKNIINKGLTIGEALEIADVLPKMVVTSVKIGEKTGALDKILKKTSDYYESEANFILDKLSTLIEPVMIIILALMVGFIVISIVMPMFAMYNAIN